MAKQVKVKKESWTQITTKSAYGSHKDMVVPTPEGVVLDDTQVVCKDDLGMYVTYKNRLDNGLADPCRYSGRKELTV